MYQHGGEPWSRWNAQVRDQLVRRQRRDGHQAGSWDPDDSLYGTRGGRIYSTALAALTLEVYYRYLRLYDEPKLPPSLAPAHGAALRPLHSSDRHPTPPDPPFARGGAGGAGEPPRAPPLAKGGSGGVALARAVRNACGNRSR